MTRASTRAGPSPTCPAAPAAAPAPQRRRATTSRTVLQGGRAKAYRPLPADQRRRAFEAGLAAYARGDFFEAHELWEPAWMGTRDLAERELIQGLIKLAAAFVHQARGNPKGVEKNLRGAQARIAAGAAAGPTLGVDAVAVLACVDTWLRSPGGSAVPITRLAARPGPDTAHDVTGPTS